MNKIEFIKEISSKTGVNIKDVDKVVSGFMSVVIQQVKKDGNVNILGFGKFEKITYAARRVRLPFPPRTIIVTKIKNALIFRQAKNVEDIIN